MNEKINLREILKDCPKGTKLYSPFFGECEFDSLRVSDVCVISNDDYFFFYQDATLLLDNIRSREPMLFPSRDLRDWSKFKVKKPKFDPRTLNPFDRVLCCHDNFSIWQCNMFSHLHPNYKELDYPVYCMSNTFMYVIPYNEDTKHLVGTKDEAPEFYRYWED